MSWKTSKFPKNQESLLHSSFIVLPRSSPDGPWINNHPPSSPSLNGPLKKAFIVHQLFILKDQAPKAPLDRQHQRIRSSVVHQAQASTALEESVHRSSLFFEIKPKSPRRSVQAQKALEDLFVIVLRVQAQKPLEIRSSLFFKIKPKSP
ncbi:hypothetical protein ACFX2G_043633 [Malus domestica]